MREGREWLAEFSHRSLGALTKVGTEVSGHDVEGRLDHTVRKLVTAAPLLDSFFDEVLEGHT